MSNRYSRVPWLLRRSGDDLMPGRHDGAGDGEGAGARAGEDEAVSAMTAPEAARLAAAALLDTLDTVDLLHAASDGRGQQGHRAGRFAGQTPSTAHSSPAGSPRQATDVGPGSPSGEPVSLIDLILAHRGRRRSRSGAADRDGHSTTHRRPCWRASREALFRQRVDAVVGPASDGGWWSLGLRNAQMSPGTVRRADVDLRHLRADNSSAPRRRAPRCPVADAHRRGHLRRRDRSCRCRTGHPVRPCLPGHLDGDGGMMPALLQYEAGLLGGSTQVIDRSGRRRALPLARWSGRCQHRG